MTVSASGDESGEAGSVSVVGVTASMGVVAAPGITEGLAAVSLNGAEAIVMIEGDAVPADV
jgi:hypothetical protein